MVWLLIPAAVGAVILIAAEYERQAREHWEHKRKKVQRSIDEHEAHIQLHIERVREVCNFYTLVEVHYSSMMVANNAYNLLGDANIAIKAMNRIISCLNKRIKMINDSIKAARNYKERKPLLNERKELVKARSIMCADKHLVISQKNEMHNKLKEFNNKTSLLKYAIRDNCGPTGCDWFERLEERTRNKRKSD